MFTHRVITALIGIPILLTGLYYGGFFWQVIVFFLVAAGLLEFARMAGEGVYLDYLLIAGLSFLLLSYSGINGTKLLIWTVLQLFYYLVRASFGGMKNFSAASNLLGVFYVAVSLSFLWLVRDKYDFLWSMFGFVTTWLTDSGAYFGGMRYGKRKLMLEISPNKTKEGALCGLLAAIFGAIIFALIVERPVVLAAILAGLLSICAQLGDLVESALKRERSVKDSGSLLPGHGGVLDRFDSIIFVFPLLFVLLNLFI